MKKLSIAIIGCGVISRRHLKAYKDIKDASVTALCDLSREALDSVGDAFGIKRRTTQADELFEDPSIDAVILALPTAVRTPLALKALAAGKHVLLEKPAAMNVAEIDTLEKARGDRIVACCSGRFRDYPGPRAARDFIRAGKLGKLRTVVCRAVVPPVKPPPESPPPWRLKRSLNGGGIFVNWGSYDLDFLLGLIDFNVQPVSALARCWRISEANKAYAAPGSDAETHVKALVRFSDGSMLDYERAEFIPVKKEERWQLIGENGSLDIHLHPSPEKKVVWNRPGPEGTEQEVIWEGGDSHIDSNFLINRNFVGAARGECEPLTPLKYSRVIQEIVDSVYQSAEENEPETANS